MANPVLTTSFMGDADIYDTEYIDDKNSCFECDSERKRLLDEDDTKQSCGHGEYPRLIARDGETNVKIRDSMPGHRRVCFQMGYAFHSMIGLKPYKLVAMFLTSYCCVFLLGGGLIYLSDITDIHGVGCYFDAVIFVGYTMTTVGFGNQYPKKPESSILPLFMVVCGLLLDAFWLGIIFARISSPRPLRHTLLLSKHAVLTHHSGSDAAPTFACRLVNLRNRYQWVDLSLKLTLSTWNHQTNSIKMEPLRVENDIVSPFLDLPWTVRHCVDEQSPMHKLLKLENGFDDSRAEVIVELNGQDPLTGNCMLKRFSYVANEILRGQAFVNVVSNEADSTYSVDMARFHDTEPLDASVAYGATSTSQEEAGGNPKGGWGARFCLPPSSTKS